MVQNYSLYLFFLTIPLSYLFSLTTLANYVPQLIALIIIIFIVFYHHQSIHLSLISLSINLIIFTSNGLASPFYFLIYFLLFSTALTIKPIPSLIFSLISIIFLGQTLDNPVGLLSLISLLFITPLVWFVSRQSDRIVTSSQTIAIDETNFLLWINLKFKTGILTILDLVSQLQSTPLSHSQKGHLKNIKASARSLLNSSQKLTSDISDNDNEI